MFSELPIQSNMAKRKIYAGLMEGIAAMQAQREGKIQSAQL
jgi:hypothetical protein